MCISISLSYDCCGFPFKAIGNIISRYLPISRKFNRIHNSFGSLMPVFVVEYNHTKSWYFW